MPPRPLTFARGQPTSVVAGAPEHLLDVSARSLDSDDNSSVLVSEEDFEAWYEAGDALGPVGSARVLGAAPVGPSNALMGSIGIPTQ